MVLIKFLRLFHEQNQLNCTHVDREREHRKMKCKVCGTEFPENDPDFIYPTNKTRSGWAAACPFCSLYVLGESEEEVLNTWQSMSVREMTAWDIALTKLHARRF